MHDDLDIGAQPPCPQCGTVLHNDGRALRCRGCDVLYLPNLTARDDLGERSTD